MNRLNNQGGILQAALVIALSVSGGLSTLVAANISEPIATSSAVFQEEGGLVVVEAEHFLEQTKTSKRQWYLTTASDTPMFEMDGDSSHVGGASGGAYLEILPDTRRNHGETLIQGENFTNQPGKLAVLHYKVHFKSTGRFYVWVRAYSSGSEDNGLHVGLDGEWPESGQRLQWCEGKRSWRWESKQRTQEVHCGEPGLIYLDVDSPGEHTIAFSMREDGFEFDCFLLTQDSNFARPADAGPSTLVRAGRLPAAFQEIEAPSPAVVEVSGDLMQWHKVTVTMDGPFANEHDLNPNPFTDYRMTVAFQHESGFPSYNVPGYFAADGDAGNSSATFGAKWRAHLSPDKAGRWSYKVEFASGKNAALDLNGGGAPLTPYDGAEGSFVVATTDKLAPDFRAKGRLQYVGRHYLQHAGTGEYFLKAGADAPETLLGYADFDGTVARKKNVPLKTWAPHLNDWSQGDPSWKGGKGKGLLGAINYLAGKGCNAFSFLTYNAGGDGDNVWPFTSRDEKLHYDCSKLDQWGIVFDHGTSKGMYLHFKLQETENDDDKRGKNDEPGSVPTSLNGGAMGIERMLYCRELVARFGHAMALNWNLGEENTQTTAQQKAMSGYIHELDPYDHNLVVHTYPGEQDKVYRPLLGDQSVLTGTSLQNSGLQDTHWQVVKWAKESFESGKPWIVGFDESGSAAHAQCPDLGYKGFDGRDKDGKMVYTQHRVRKQTLWGSLMGGGAGVEYYFGYKFAENDLVCEDWRSRDQSWDYCRYALEFFRNEQIPFWDMRTANQLVGASDRDNSKYCFARKDEIYLVYLAEGGSSSLDLSDTRGSFKLRWFNPRSGGKLKQGSVKRVKGGSEVSLGVAPRDAEEDWLVVVRR